MKTRIELLSTNGSRRWHLAVCTTFVAASICFMASSLKAGEITGFTWYSGVASTAATTIDPALTWNDNIVGISGIEAWLTQKDYTAIGPVDIEFSVRDNGGVTEYKFREGVSNSSGITWEGYHIELGFGNGAGFVKSTALDELDFDSPDFDSLVDFNPGPGVFTSWDVFEDDIIAYDGDMVSGEFAGYFIFHVDVPDGITSFTLRQSPIETIPEPSSLMLAVLGLVPLGWFARRMRRRG